MSRNGRIEVYLSDGTLLVDSKYSSAVAEENESRLGNLTVAEAQTLVEKWAKLDHANED